MSHERDEINFNLLSLKNFDDESFAEEVLSKVVNGLSFVKVSKFGSYAPLKGRVNPKDIDSLKGAWFDVQEVVTPFSEGSDSTK